MNLHEAATYLNVSTKTIERYKQRGVLPYRLVSRQGFLKKLEFKAEDLDTLTPDRIQQKVNLSDGKPQNMTWIYLIKDSDSGLCKIGYSNNPGKRLRELTRQPTLLPSPHNFQLLDAFHGSMSEEHLLHKHYQIYRVRGEWFNLVFNDYMDISYCFELRPRFPSIRWDVEDKQSVNTFSEPKWFILNPKRWRSL